MKRNVTMRDIERLSRQSARILYGYDADKRSNHPDQCDSKPLTDRQMAGVITATASSPAIDRNMTGSMLVNPLRIIRAQSTHHIPFLLRSEAATLAGVKGAATLIQAEKVALAAHIIERHEIARAKTKVVLWEITNKGYEYLELAQPKWASKGGYKHKFCAHRIARAFSDRGYRTIIEYRRPNGKLVDLSLTKDNETTYVEICASYPVEKEIVNVEKNLDGAPVPTEMICAVTDRKMRRPLEEALGEFTRESSVVCPISVVLAGDLIAPLESIR